MRKWAALLLLLGLAWPAFAAKPLTLVQLEELLTSLRDKPDGHAAERLDDVYLTERVSPARFAQWKSEFPGKRTSEALTRLADLSAFLDPPQDDVLPNPRPDIQTQKQMLFSALQYVATTTTRLPNLLANRETTHFETPPVDNEIFPSRTDGRSTLTGTFQDRTFEVGTVSDIIAPHSTGTFSRTVTYRDGHEVIDEDPAKEKKEPAWGLTTSGEFGPILGLVIGDVMHSHVSWLRWERGANAPVAEFRYSIPKPNSHYSVGITRNGKVEQLYPPYHGEIQIDPATGEILRLTVETDMEPPYSTMQAAIVVEYAPVTIGDRRYICPVRGVAFSKTPISSTAGTHVADSAMPVQAELNDVAFTDYHIFRSDLRIVTNNSGSSDTTAVAEGGTMAQQAPAVSTPEPAPSPPSTPPATSPAPAQEASSAPVAGSAPVPAAQPATVAAANPPPGPSSVPTPTPAPAAEPTPPQATPPADTTKDVIANSPTLRTETKLVLVDVVVSDHDHPVRSLDRSRFHVFEDGHEQPIASFDESTPAATATITHPASLPPNTFTNAPAYPETSVTNVLLLDALNTPMDAQDQVRRQMIQYLSTMRPGTSLAIFTLSSRLRMAAGFTTDVARLADALKKQKINSHASEGAGPGRNADLSTTLLQQASQLNNNNDPGTLWLVQQIVQFAADMKTYDTDQRVGMTLEALTQLAQYLTAVPGRKNLIWFSGSFPIALWPDPNLRTQYRDLRDYTDELEKTSQLLATARVAVYPVDARGVTTAPTSDSSYIAPPAGTGSAATRLGIQNDNKTFFVESSQERSTMTTIAAQTGGHVYSTGNDLKQAVDKILADDSIYYALSYVPPQDKDPRKGSQFHRIEVKVDGSKYQLAYRGGYYTAVAAKPSHNSGEDSSAIAAATVLGAPPATQILFQARVLPQGDPQLKNTALDQGQDGAPSASPAPPTLKGEPHRYIVDLSVDPRNLMFTQEADGARRTQLDCALVAYDGEGQKVNSLGGSFTFNLPPDQYQRLQSGERPLPVRLALDLPAGDSVLRIVLFGSESAMTGSLEIPVHVAPKQ